MLHADSASHTRCGCVALDGSNRSSGALPRVGGATTPLPSDPSGDVPGGRWAAGGSYNLIWQQSWEVVRDLDAAGGYEGGAVIVGFREIWVA